MRTTSTPTTRACDTMNPSPTNSDDSGFISRSSPPMNTSSLRMIYETPTTATTPHVDKWRPPPLIPMGTLASRRAVFEQVCNTECICRIISMQATKRPTNTGSTASSSISSRSSSPKSHTSVTQVQTPSATPTLTKSVMQSVCALWMLHFE
jgi:hypothetical protein